MMRQFTNRTRLAATLGTLAALLLCSSAARAQDPVDELQKALSMRSDERRAPTEAMLEYRRAALEKRVAALRTIADLRRALVMWKSDPDLISKDDPRVTKMDDDFRTRVGTRLRKSLANAAKDKNIYARLAAANLIAEMGPTVRALEQGDFNGYARSLEPIAIALVRDSDLGVRLEALRALGNINADPKSAIPVLVQALQQTDKEAEARREAARAMLQMVKVVNALQGQTKTGIAAGPMDLADTAGRVLRGAGAGLIDPDAQVRKLCLEAIQAVAAAYAQTPGAYKRTDFPPHGRALTPNDILDIKMKYEAVRKYQKELYPVLKEAADQGKPLAQTLLDPDLRVRQAALSTSQDLAHLRLRLRQRVVSLPTLPEGKAPKSDPEFATPLDGLVKELLPNVIAIADDADVTVRRRAVEFIEQLDEDGAPGIPTLIARLLDGDRFVRWAAARALDNLDPRQIRSAVPVLARLLYDPDLDVRLATVRTLEGMGPHARAAVPFLLKGILFGDPEIRIGIMHTVASIGPEHAQDAIPNLIRSLNYEASPDARVRQTAAEILGKFGPSATTAVPALRQALGDDDADVRSRAADALLSILVPAAKD
ncbi:MAG: HEAT repeat domain-containing protein [Planctomycetes bacterium]|nr:HEAT repeat domain-containing protein [Planctomycetota bacterium]